MANALGVSTVGLQRLIATTFPDDGTIAIDFRNNPYPGRLTRLGTILISQPIFTPTRYRTLAVYKLYGNGIVTPPLDIVKKFSLSTEVWVNWFQSGIQWTVGTY